MIVAGFEKMNPYYDKQSDVVILKSSHKLTFKCVHCGCEFMVSKKFCGISLAGEFVYKCPECKWKCYHR